MSVRIFEHAASGNTNNNTYEELDPKDYDTVEEYEAAVEEQQRNASEQPSPPKKFGSGQFGSANLKDSYRSNTGYENFRKYFNDLSPNIVQDCLNSFDTQADLLMQKEIAETLFSGGRATININELQGKLAAKGISVSTEYVSAQYRVDEFAVGGQGYVTNGAITVMTFRDNKGGEIKIADANGNAALETDELFMNEILGGISTDISNMSPEPAIGEIDESSNDAEDDFLKKYFEARMERLKQETINKDELNEKEFTEIKEALINDLCEELMKEYPELTKSEARSKAESSVNREINKKYTLQDNGNYKLNYGYV